MNFNKLWTLEYSPNGTFHVHLAEDMVLANTDMIAKDNSNGHILIGLFSCGEAASEASDDIDKYLKLCKMADIKLEVSKLFKYDSKIPYKGLWAAEFSASQDCLNVARIDQVLKGNLRTIVRGRRCDYQTFRFTEGNDGASNACAAMRKMRARRAG
jgi:hypothetical protein